MRLLTEDDNEEAVANIVEAKWLTGREEAAATVAVATFPFCFSGQSQLVFLGLQRQLDTQDT